MTHLQLAAAVSAAILLAAGCWLWPALRPPPVPIEVISGDWATRRRWRGRLGDGVRRLRRAAGAPPGADLAVLVVEWLPDGQRATRSPARRRRDGRLAHLVSLALTTPERRLTPDEVLAALAEQYLAVTLAPKPRGPRAPTGPAVPDRTTALLADLGIARDGPGHGQ